MKDKKNYLILFAGIVLGVSIVGIVICFTIGRINLVDKTYSTKSNSYNIKEDIKEIEQDEVGTIPVYEVYQDVKESVKQKSQSNTEVKSVKEETITDEVTTSSITSEDINEEVVNFVEKVENEILTEENINKVLYTAKTEFVKIVDFIFYGAEINGYTFEQLTDEAKLYVTNVAIELDATLEELRPGYKDEIKLEVTNFIDKATTKYLEISDKICTEMGTVACNQAKQDLQVLKEDFGLTLDLAKVVTKHSLSSLKSWYEIFRESN